MKAQYVNPSVEVIKMNSCALMTATISGGSTGLKEGENDGTAIPQ